MVRPSGGVDGDDLALGGCGDLLAAERVGPQVGLVHAEERGDGVPVAAVGCASLGDPAFDGLGVDLSDGGQVGEGHSAFEEYGAQSLVGHLTCPLRDVRGRANPSRTS